MSAVLMACSGRDEGPQAHLPPPPPTAEAPFQHHLDRLGVPLRLPEAGKAIVVNVPAFELVMFDDAQPVSRSRVIVGSPWNPTPRLMTQTSVVRFRPTWRPTPAMIASGEHEDRLWPPGPGNPLGLAAVRLEEGLLIYLHGTNRPELFERDARALSHGCVRVERWDELVAWVLDLELDEVHRLANGTVTLDVPTTPVPVVFGYFTVFPDDAGEEVRYQDVYGLSGAELSLVNEVSAVVDEPSDQLACDGAQLDY